MVREDLLEKVISLEQQINTLTNNLNLVNNTLKDLLGKLSFKISNASNYQDYHKESVSTLLYNIENHLDNAIDSLNYYE
jgi:hypothetical protein